MSIILKEIFSYLLKQRPQLIERLTNQLALTEEIKRELEEALHNFFRL